jgi:putative membrane protein
MTEHPYRKFSEEELALRDVLATDRTILANERTFLAYVNTAIALFVGGLTLIKLFHTEALLYTLGQVSVPMSFVVAVYGYLRYARKERALTKVVSSLEKASEKGYNPLMQKILTSLLTLRRAS